MKSKEVRLFAEMEYSRVLAKEEEELKKAIKKSAYARYSKYSDVRQAQFDVIRAERKRMHEELTEWLDKQQDMDDIMRKFIKQYYIDCTCTLSQHAYFDAGIRVSSLIRGIKAQYFGLGY